MSWSATRRFSLLNWGSLKNAFRNATRSTPNSTPRARVAGQAALPGNIQTLNTANAPDVGSSTGATKTSDPK